jgi:hypothetical protein
MFLAYLVKYNSLFVDLSAILSLMVITLSSLFSHSHARKGSLAEQLFWMARIDFLLENPNSPMIQTRQDLSPVCVLPEIETLKNSWLKNAKQGEVDRLKKMPLVR